MKKKKNDERLIEFRLKINAADEIIYLQPSGNADGYAQQLRILTEFGFGPSRKCKHFCQTIIHKFNIYQRPLIILDKLSSYCS
jgi:hypothetical protein